MADQEQPVKPPKIRPWRYLPILLILGLAIHLLVPQITTLEKSMSVVRHMSWWAIALAILAQIFSYLSSGYVLQTILSADQPKFKILKGTLITIGSSSIGLVAGGWLGGGAATYKWVRKENCSKNDAILAGILPAMLNSTVLIGMALLGTLYLLIIHDLNKAQLIEFSIILLVLGLVIVGGVYALRSPERTSQFVLRLAKSWAELRRKPFAPQAISESVTQFLKAWISLPKQKWLRALLGVIANVSFDMLTLFFVFVATGHNVSPGTLFAGYGLPLILGKMAFLFPGGVGVIEGSMVVLYDSLKVPNAVSVVVILGYRLISFWLPTLLGFAAAAYLSNKSSTRTNGLHRLP